MKRLVALATCAALLLPATAVAAPEQEAPWEVGVPEAQRDQAEKLVVEGNELSAQQAYAAALERFTQALALWDHPAIHWNMAHTLLKLERKLEAADELDAALRYGAAPFSPEEYSRVLDYQKLVGDSIGELEVTCGQAGVSVSVDGAPFVSCPGSRKQRIAVGEHLVVGESATLVPESRRVSVPAAKTTKVAMELRTLDQSIVLEYPTPRWIPWTVTGGGVVLAGLGVLLTVGARSAMDDLNVEIEGACAMGCTAEETATFDKRVDSIQFDNNVGLATLIVGGLVAAGGVTWTILNRPRSKTPVLEAAPTSGGFSASATWRF